MRTRNIALDTVIAGLAAGQWITVSAAIFAPATTHLWGYVAAVAALAVGLCAATLTVGWRSRAHVDPLFEVDAYRTQRTVMSAVAVAVIFCALSGASAGVVTEIGTVVVVAAAAAWVGVRRRTRRLGEPSRPAEKASAVRSASSLILTSRAYMRAGAGVLLLTVPAAGVVVPNLVIGVLLTVAVAVLAGAGESVHVRRILRSADRLTGSEPSLLRHHL